MKHQALFSLKDKSKNNKSVVCCSFAWHFKGEAASSAYNRDNFISKNKNG